MIEEVYAIGNRVVLKGKYYYGEIDRTPQEIRRWIAFYEKMRDRKNGKFAKFYAHTIEQLETVYAQEKAQEDHATGSTTRRVRDL